MSTSNKPRKGTVLVYTGSYAPSVKESAKYGPGVVVGAKRGAYDDEWTVTVQLVDGGNFADWKVSKTELA